MKKRILLALGGLLMLQAVWTPIGRLSAALSADTLSWSWEVSTTVSTMTKTCTLEFTGPLTLNWGDGQVQTLSDSLSGTVLTHVYASVANFACRATGTGILYFKADSRRLLSLDPTKAPALTYLSCTSNQLAALDVTNNPELISLYCGSNSLTALNVTKCLKLQTLTCSDNKLTQLNVSSVPSLKKLTCHTNLLTTLRVCPTGSLSYLSCLNCSIQVAELDTLLAQLPSLAAISTSKNLYVLNNPGSTNCNIQLAMQKNWTPDKTVTSSSFYMPTATANTGETVELDVCLTNPTNVVAFELDLVFPPGFVLDTVRTCLAAARKGAHLLSLARTAPNQYKCMAYSMTSRDLIKGNSGVVLQLFGSVPDTAKSYSVQLKQAVLVDSAANTCAFTLTNGTLTVVPASVNGDVNGDKVVNVTDVVNLVAYINGRNPLGFNAQAADLDNNGLYNVADIVKMVLLVNASGTSLRSSFTDEGNPGRSLVLYDQATVQPGNNLYLRCSAVQPRQLELCLSNVQAVQAFQVDLQLPEGVSLSTNGVLGNRQNGHHFQVTDLGCNRYRLLAYSLRPDAAFKGDSGVLVVLPLSVSETLPSAQYPVFMDNQVLTGLNLQTLPSHGFDLSTTLGEAMPVSNVFMGTDESQSLWVEGADLRDVSVWDLTGRLLHHQTLSNGNRYSHRFVRGVYVVQARSGLKTSLRQKVVVR